MLHLQITSAYVGWRKRRHKDSAIFCIPAFRTKEATWVLLTQLGSNTLQRFEAANRLRRASFPTPPCVPYTV